MWSGTYHVPTFILTLYVDIYTVSKNVPPLVYYNFDIRERILIFLAEMLPIKQAIKRRFTMPPQITCASALPGKTGKHKKSHFFTQMLYQCTARIQLVAP